MTWCEPMTTKSTARPTGKSVYTRMTEARIAEAGGKLATVKARMRAVIAGGQVEAGETLQKAQAQADSQLARVQRRLDRLKDADEDSWEGHTAGIERAWDDLSLSIKKIVTRLL